MKCDDCLNLLESYVDGETGAREAEQVRLHLTTCANCETRFEALAAESEMYARYDRELQISPALWNGIAARIAPEADKVAAPKFDLREWLTGLFAAPAFRFAMPAVALVLIAVLVGLAFWRTRPQPPPVLSAGADNSGSAPSVGIKPPVESPSPAATGAAGDKQGSTAGPIVASTKQPGKAKSLPDTQPDVLFRDAAYSDLEERDTASHLEQAQNLLVSFRNIKFSDDDEEVDVTYEKAESRRLLNENVLLRRDAEMAGKFPAKAMLGSLEPFLIDIANLPDKAKPADVSQITDRVQRTEIVAELRGY